MQDNIFYNYVYLDPRKPGDYNYGELHFDYEPFLIGKGKGNRMYKHLNETEENTYNPHKVRIINKIKNEGLNPIILKIFENLDESIALENEIRIISLIGKSNDGLGPLTNLTDGGEGSSGYKWTKEMKLEQSKNMKGDKNPFFNKKHTIKNKLLWSINKIGNKHPMYGKTHNNSSIEQNKKSQPNKKSVYQLDLNDNIINFYISVHAASKETIINRGSIIQCCKGKYKTAGGFKWKFAK